MRAIKPRRWAVQRDIQMLVRTFPAVTIVIFRGQRIYDNGEVVGWDESHIVYRGEALKIPATGTVADYGLGQVENLAPQLLISGDRDIQQADFVRLDGRLYQVEFPPNPWRAYTQVKLKQYEQGA